jgi:hypothetical protein
MFSSLLYVSRWIINIMCDSQNLFSLNPCWNSNRILFDSSCFIVLLASMCSSNVHEIQVSGIGTGTCFIQKIYAPSSSLLQGKHLPFSPSPLRLNIFSLCVIISLTQLYRYTPELFLFSTATFKYTYRAPLRRIGQEYSAKVAFSTSKSLKRTMT